MGKIQSFRAWAKAQLVITHLRVAFFNLVQFIKEIFLYYRNIDFAKSDLRLKKRYLLKNPYQISKQFLEKKGEKEIYTYGETPLTTWDLIAKKSQILSHDVVYDLGCGSGRGCLWLSSFIGCQTVGIDFVPKFIENANAINLEKAVFWEKNFLDVCLDEATVIYLAATHFDEELLEKLARRIKKGTKLITVSQKIKGCKQIREFEGKFPWGKSKIFVLIKD